MLAMHGAFFLQVKTEGAIQKRARICARISALLMVILFIVCGVWSYYGVNGYVLNGVVAHDGPSNPLYKDAIIQAGAWFANYQIYPITLLVPIAAVVMALLALLFANKHKFAFILSSLSVASVIGTVGVSMFPFILPSSTTPKNSLIVWDSSSSQLTLFIMLIVVVIFLPIVLAYTTWVYRVLRGKVTEETIKANQDSAY